jgi:hypothetical protein
MMPAKGSEAPTQEAKYIKNKYFVYGVPDDKGVSHRKIEQVWNVDGVIVWVQGTLDSIFAPYKKTFFAKRHLITFDGGHQSTVTNGTQTTKALTLSMKRTNPVPATSSGIKRKKRAIESKYGALLTDTNTAVICDIFEPDELKKLFAEACKTATDKNGKLIASLTLPSKAVMIVSNGNAAASVPGVVEADDTVDVELLIKADSTTNPTKFAIVHLEGVNKSP